MQPDDDKTRTHVTLTSGMMVSHYRIVEKIGAGGMGEVYLAEDTNLNRQIAIKVLPDMFGSDQERLARFEREAKLLASLNHPNLTTIHGLDNVQGKRLLVMELVEGETLAERIAKGPLPIGEALEIFRQIGAGMEAAHEKGIIHRDLKPANIKITPEGKVKILDFGLAKALHGESVAADLANSPTITENMTRAGVILGTAAYMSPEQAKGKPVDKRTDIWAFGCIVFECLTGKRAFEGETVSDTLAAILRGEPEWEQLPVQTPPHIRALLHRCLQKDCSHRLRDIGDATLDAPDSTAPSSEIRERRGRSWGAFIPWVVAALMVATAAYLWYSGRGKQPTDQRPIYTSVNPPENSVGCFRDGVALAPDGSKIAFVSLSSKGERLVWVRSFDRPDAVPLPGTDGANYPFWSPDSKHVAFYAGGWLKRMSAEGGPVQKLCRALSSGAYGGCWGSAGSILFCDANSYISKVAETGGDPVTIPPSEEMGFPCFLPDGKRFLYTRVVDGDYSIWLSSLDDSGFGKEINGTSGVWRAEWIPPDRLFLYVNSDRSLATQRVDLSASTIVGSRNLLAERVVSSSDWPAFSVSQTGTAAFIVNPPEASNDVASRLIWVDRKGNSLGNLGEVGGYWYIRISPDGRRVICNPDNDTWVFEVASGLVRRVTSEMASGSGAYNPTWSPTGDQILARTSGGFKEYPLSGGPPKEVFRDSLGHCVLTDWSHDGKYLLCDRFESGENLSDVAYFDFASHQIKPFLATRAYEQCGQFSPDGRWVAYVSDETGSDEVYVRSFPDGAHVKRVSYAGGMHPRWRADGKELFFLAPGWTVMSAAVTFQPNLEISTPVALFQTTMADICQGTVSPYDVTPDGQRFLVISPQTKPIPLTLVQNWQAHADRR
jgi:serine/threonine protein kinase